MAKTSTIIKHAAGDFIDADEWNQNLENAGSEGGLIPYDVGGASKDTDGNLDIGALANPYQDIYIHQSASLKLVDPSVPEVTETIPFSDIGAPSGVMYPWLGSTAPSGYLLCYGQEVSKTTYSDIWINLLDGLQEGTADGTFTATVATDRINITAHGLSDGDIVTFTSSSSLPGGLSAATTYYIINSTTNDFQVSLLPAGSSVTITSTGSGTHSYHTNFKMPDMRGRGFSGLDNMGGSSANRVTDAQADVLGGVFGAETHSLIDDEIPILTGAIDYTGGGNINPAIQTPSSAPTSSGDVRSNVVNNDSAESAHNNMQPTFFGNWIMKT